MQHLETLGWTIFDLRRRLRVHRNTTTNWQQRQPPTVVLEYLRLAVRVKKLGEQFGQQMKGLV